MDEKRLVIAVFGVIVAAVLAFLAYQFIAATTVAIFLYYSTRRFHKALRRLRLPAAVRAMITLASLAIPLLLLISYTLVLLVVEGYNFVSENGIPDFVSNNVPWLQGIDTIPEPTLGNVYEAYQAGELDQFIDFAVEYGPQLAGPATDAILSLFVAVVVTYYLLVDGARLREWLLRYDEDAIVREYFEAADKELEAVLFGNLLNVIATSLIAIVVFQGYNAFVPAAVEVPYPTLAGALTGVGSLIPVVGMKIVYVPLTGIAAIPVATGGGDPSLLVYIGGLLALAIVVVDTIPDLVLRPMLSGEATHVGLLMLAYTIGPVVLGPYGLFFAPIVLVIGMTFANTALPRLLGEEPESPLHRDQARLDDF
jgi:predicted PurR-regulated permease PerM